MECEGAPNYRFVRGDICDAELAARLFKEHDIRGVVHFAAESHVDNSISGPRAVSAKRRVTPLSLIKLPKNNIPNNGKPDGTKKAVNNKPTIGKTIFSVCETALGGFIRITRSFFVVSNLINGGWIIGTNAIYEYADTAIAPIKLGANLDDKKIAVGPSAPPIIPIAPAWLGSNPICNAMI